MTPNPYFSNFLPFPCPCIPPGAEAVSWFWANISEEASNRRPRTGRQSLGGVKFKVPKVLSPTSSSEGPVRSPMSQQSPTQRKPGVGDRRARAGGRDPGADEVTVKALPPSWKGSAESRAAPEQRERKPSPAQPSMSVPGVLLTVPLLLLQGKPALIPFASPRIFTSPSSPAHLCCCLWVTKQYCHLVPKFRSLADS